MISELFSLLLLEYSQEDRLGQFVNYTNSNNMNIVPMLLSFVLLCHLIEAGPIFERNGKI